MILVSGMVAGDPHHGGATWAVLQYVLGLKRLGHEVLVVEPVPELAGKTISYFEDVVRRFDLEDAAALVVRGTRETLGLSYAKIAKLARRADVLLNLSGMLSDPVLTEQIPARVYLDLDPAFNQLWHEAERIDVGFDGHTHFVTVGLTLGEPECGAPTCGFEWLTTLQPVVLEQWPPAGRIDHHAFTTVGNWRGYGSIEQNGVFYGQKAHSLRDLFALPTRTRERFLLALAIHPDERNDLAALDANGWELLDPAEVAGDPESYRTFIKGSKAEFGLAKSGYVASRCGWFSDRSACYLASGRPVLAQDTGFTRFLPTGEGLLPFATVDDAVAGVEAITGDYVRHARAARAIAEEHFDSDRVLGRLLDRL